MKRSLAPSIPMLLAATLLVAGCGGKGGSSSSSSAAGGADQARGMLGAEGGQGAPESGMPAGGDESGSPTASSAAGIAWTVPSSWVIGADRAMRVATYSIPAAGGDAEAAECGVFYFGPNQGGGVDANIERWIGQFESGAKSNRSSKTVSGLRVELVEVGGSYLAPSGPMMQSSGTKPGSKLLGAIAEGPEGAVFFKLTGPKRTVDAARRDFDTLVASLKKQ